MPRTCRSRDPAAKSPSLGLNARTFIQTFYTCVLLITLFASLVCLQMENFRSISPASTHSFWLPLTLCSNIIQIFYRTIYINSSNEMARVMNMTLVISLVGLGRWQVNVDCSVRTVITCLFCENSKFPNIIVKIHLIKKFKIRNKYGFGQIMTKKS